ncbi:hypothetical protein CEE36_03615 [candidate division TA06 bacterium B3_TA06]|uniref:Uncharacterized protein n=1 Tax=candidate division TA06 bacterium B3_TA06 TaxID=2012487 RepID=A0A532V8A9_UNCT6|nr:MAG: hypothetical protein CEE36_03615 [candidate division TA06 bacterium B3_TA06]
MSVLGLVREVGIPLALLIAAVIALWRAWRLERRMRERDLQKRRQRLLAREDELYFIYRQLALRELANLVEGSVSKEERH